MNKSLAPEFLLQAYALGFFPMGIRDQEIAWFSPDPRGIIPLESFHESHGLRRALKRDWDIRVDTTFHEVIQECAARKETWISESIAQSYTALYQAGYAHSVEVWHQGKLAGGLYGVALGSAFFGESMFHRMTDASSVALWHLICILNQEKFTLLDIQWHTKHLAQFGALEISRDEYLLRLKVALGKHANFPKGYSASSGSSP